MTQAPGWRSTGLLKLLRMVYYYVLCTELMVNYEGGQIMWVLIIIVVRIDDLLVR